MQIMYYDTYENMVFDIQLIEFRLIDISIWFDFISQIN